ncbi:MAG: HypC/HybG/HupF family hydrogenase formation chaperone [Thaumarchaeota archaeon]|nr:HypC/HybG/HupF family hydrogenase formation chaperone [Nitrososphaerota archaeon]
MCITRVGKVSSASHGRAAVEFFDGRALEDVDVSMLRDVEAGTFVEVYGNLALSVLAPAEARKRKAAWAEVRKAAMVVAPRRGKGR